MAINQSKQRYKIKVIRKNDGAVISDREDTSSYGGAYGGHLGIPPKIGQTITYITTVTSLGDHQYKQSYAKRLAAQQRNDEAKKKREAAREAKLLVLRRARIMNQIELAFAKNGKDAVKFVTCDLCHDLAAVLTLTHENPGSTVVSPEQIAGARCADHTPHGPLGNTIRCDTLEFFYDGVKQIYVNKQK